MKEEARVIDEDHEKIATVLNKKEVALVGLIQEAKQRKKVLGEEDKLFMESEKLKSQKQEVIEKYLKERENYETALKKTNKVMEQTRTIGGGSKINSKNSETLWSTSTALS